MSVYELIFVLQDDSSESPKTAESHFLDINETVEEQREKFRIIFQKEGKKNNARYKNYPVKKNTAAVYVSMLESRNEDIEARFPKNYDEYVESVAARKR